MASKQTLEIGGGFGLLSAALGAYSVLAESNAWTYGADALTWAGYVMVAAFGVLLYSLLIERGGSRGIGGVLIVSAWMYVIGSVLAVLNVLGVSLGLGTAIEYILGLIAWLGLGGFAVALWIEWRG